MTATLRNLFQRTLNTQLLKTRNHLCTCNARCISQTHLDANEAQTFRPEIAEVGNLMQIGTHRIWSEEHDIFRASARRFFREEVAPNRERWEEAGFTDREIWLRAGELGLLGVAIPEEAGGLGSDILTAAILWEEQWMANCSAPSISLVSDLIMPYIVEFGTQEQIARYIPPMVAGKCIGAIAMTEPHAGSDLQAIRTNARRDGEDWILNGSKVFISHGYLADVLVVAAVTEPSAKSPAHGMSLFLLDADTPGFHKGRRLNKIGIRSEDTVELFFEDVRLSKDQLLGQENRGWFHMMQLLPQERMVVAGRAQGHMEMIYETTREYVKERKAFGKRIADFQTVQHKLAELKTRICVSRAFYNQCLAIHNDRGIDNQMSAMVKYITTDLDNHVATECLQLHGGYGYMSDCPVAKAFLDARIQSIWGGTNEIMKNIIAKSILMA